MRLIALVAALALTGCATPPARVPVGQVTEAAWASQVTVKRDPYTKITLIQAGDIKVGGWGSTIHLRAAHRDDRPDIEPKISVYASLFYYEGNWRFYERANTIDGQSWPTRSAARNVRDCTRYRCSYSELVLVDFPFEYLRSHIRDGVDLKIAGPGGEEAFFIPPAYLSAFLSEVPHAR